MGKNLNKNDTAGEDLVGTCPWSKPTKHRRTWRNWRRGILRAGGIVLLLIGGAGIGGATIAAQTTGTEPSTATAEQNVPAAGNGAEREKQNTDQFRLSRERYEKAVAYSRAGYAS